MQRPPSAATHGEAGAAAGDRLGHGSCGACLPHPWRARTRLQPAPTQRISSPSHSSCTSGNSMPLALSL